MTAEPASAMWVESLALLAMERHAGGAPFFDALDRLVRRPEIFARLLKLGAGEYSNVVVSGRFGRRFRACFGSSFERCLWVPGGMHSNSIKLNLLNHADALRSRRFVFVDDSCYSLLTRDKIAVEIGLAGGRLVESYVAYDGSANRDSSVHSLIQYYA